MAFSLKTLYAAEPKSEGELQIAIDGVEGKAGKDLGMAALAAADALRIREDYQSAFARAKQAVTTFREVGSDEQEALALCLVAKIRTAAGGTLEALQASKKALKIFREAGNAVGQAVASYTAALAHEAGMSPEDAAWKAAEARKGFQEAGDKVGEAVALEAVARCHFMQQDFKKGLPAAQDALAMFRELGQGTKEAAILCILAKMHMGRGEFEMALQMAKDAISKYEQLGQSTGSALDIAMDIYMKMGSKDDAVFTAQQEVERLRQVGDPNEEARVMMKIAELHMKAGKPDQALAPASEATSLFRSCADRKGECEGLVLMAKINFILRDKNKTEKLAEQAINMAKELGEPVTDTAVAAVRVFCELKAQARAFQPAFDVSVGSMNHFKGLGNGRGEGGCLLIISELQIGINDQSGSFNTLKAAITCFVNAGAKKDLAAANIKLSQTCAARSEMKDALKAAEEALAMYRKLNNNEGKADALQLVATAHFGLGRKGNPLEAIRSAREAVAIYEKLGEKIAEANALNVLANSQLMNQSFADAQRTARKAEAIFRDMDDQDGQAGALLLVAGAHLGIGEFAEAKDIAKEARALFEESGNGKGEDGAVDFLDALKQYDSGALNRMDFQGFTMTSGEPADKSASDRTKAKEKKKDTSILSNVDLYLPGPKGDKLTVTFFEAFEARRATAPTRGPAARRASEAAGAEGEEEKVKQVMDPVLYAIRLMPKDIEGEEVVEKKPKYESIDPEDKRLNMSVDLGQPNVKFPGNTGKTDRMFSAMGAQKL